jgi:tight adherence protein B
VTATGWLALTAAVLVCAAPSRSRLRLRELTAHRRLAAGSRSPSRLGWPAPHRVFGAIAAVLAVAGVGAISWRFGPVLGAAAAAVALLTALLARDALSTRAATARRAGLRAAVRVLVAELEIGALPADALTAAAQVAPRYTAVLQAAGDAARGGDAAAVLRADPDTRVLGVAWSLGQDSGAPLADVLRRVADDLSATEEQRRAVVVALSGPRSSAVMLAGLPVVGIALGASTGARPLAFLTGSPAGRLVCCVGVLLDVAGVLWMRRILRRALRS